jgi:DNA-binding response OmpR family regulator
MESKTVMTPGPSVFEGIPADLPKRVLIVDDDRDIRQLLATFIGRLNADVSQAVNGEEALRMFRERPFDLVITDIEMPVMDGLILMKRIKALSGDTPVVIITGQTVGSIERSGGLAPAETVLYKPFSLDTIKAVLETVFDRGKKDRQQ